MANITLRQNTPLGLTNEQVDNNFISLNNGIYQVAGTNLYPDFDFIDPSFYSADSGTTWGFNQNSPSINGGNTNTLTISTANKSVYTGWFKVEPNTVYSFSSTQKTLNVGGTSNVYVEFASVTDYTTNSFAPTTKTLIASNTTTTQTNIVFSLKTGVNDRRARFVLENLGSSTGCIFGELKCLETQKSHAYKNNLFLNNAFENNSLSGWSYTSGVNIFDKSALLSANTQFNNAPKWVGLERDASLMSHCSIGDLYSKGVYCLSGQQFKLDYILGTDTGTGGGFLRIYMNHLGLNGTFTKTQLYSTSVGSESGATSYSMNFIAPSTGMFNISFETQNTLKRVFVGAPCLKTLVVGTEIASGQISFSHLDTVAVSNYGGSLKKNGIASVGTADSLTRIDHVHPRDDFGGMKNHIINGNFMFWQRGVSQTTTGYGSADRWKIVSSGSGFTHTLSRENVNSTISEKNHSKYCAKISIAGMTAGLGNKIKLVQSMEGIRKFYGKNIVLSFWGKASSNKSISAILSSPHSDYSYNSTSSYPSLTTTWKKFEYVFTPSIISTTTIDANAKAQEDSGQSTYLNLELVLSSGVVGDPQYLFNGDIYITDVQIEFGDASTDFENRDIYTEEQLCKRYYEFIEAPINGLNTGMDFARTNYNFTVPKRTVPSVTVRQDLMTHFPNIYMPPNGVGIITNIIPTVITKSGINEMTMTMYVDGSFSWGAFITDPVPISIDAEI